jgi:hypothetical protein
MQTCVLVVNGEQNENYISDIQHVRRRETIAMTPSDSFYSFEISCNALACCLTKSNVEADKNQF